jgi:hypothetical protein
VRAAYQGLGIDVADIHATLVVEKDLVALATRTDGQVVLIRGLVGHERLHQEVLEYALDAFDIDLCVKQQRTSEISKCAFPKRGMGN